eukprot:5729194-Prymnesium_polylepis.2
MWVCTSKAKLGHLHGGGVVGYLLSGAARRRARVSLDRCYPEAEPRRTALAQKGGNLLGVHTSEVALPHAVRTRSKAVSTLVHKQPPVRFSPEQTHLG